LRRINLLPPEERRGGAVDLGGRRGVYGILLVLGAVALVLMAGLYLFYAIRLGNEQEQIARLDSEIAQRNQRIAELDPFRDLQAQLQAKEPVADGIFRSRFLWDEFLQGLSFVIPPEAALETLTAEAAPVNVQAPVDEELRGAATFTGVALPEYENVSAFILRLNTLRFVSDAQLNSAELDRETYADPAITFEVASELITRVGEAGTQVRIEGDPETRPEGEAPEDAPPVAQTGEAGRVP
jgi:type IV pilus assembly protein PilN